MRNVVLLPALFLVVVAPIAWWVVSGRGTHMSPLMLYPFATPWWMLFQIDYISTLGEEVTSQEHQRLIIGCAINAVILAAVGWAFDRWRSITRNVDPDTRPSVGKPR